MTALSINAVIKPIPGLIYKSGPLKKVLPRPGFSFSSGCQFKELVLTRAVPRGRSHLERPPTLSFLLLGFSFKKIRGRIKGNERKRGEKGTAEMVVRSAGLVSYYGAIRRARSLLRADRIINTPRRRQDRRRRGRHSPSILSAWWEADYEMSPSAGSTRPSFIWLPS